MGSGRGVTPLVDFARQRAVIQNSHINSALAEFLGMFIFVVNKLDVFIKEFIHFFFFIKYFFSCWLLGEDVKDKF